jgi:hypothetical protein
LSELCAILAIRLLVVESSEGYGDAVTQMEMFYRSEPGAILPSDIDVVYEGDNIQLMQSTQSRFPVLANGSEIVMLTSVTREDETAKLNSVISALFAVGSETSKLLHGTPWPRYREAAR